jgi:hypothetical protein
MKPVTLRYFSMIHLQWLILAFLAAFSLFACNSTKKTDDITLSGHYVNDTFLETIPDTIPAMIPAYCFELNFTGDSVQINFGFKEATFAYLNDGENYRIVKAMQDQDMPFKINDDQTITLVDTAWTKSAKSSTFKKATVTSNQKWAFETYLNQQMIAGAYKVFENGQPTLREMSFAPDGTVVGLAPFTAYSVCYSGDCAEETYPISNQITFSTPDKKRVTYAFIKNKTDKTISLYHIEEPKIGIKGERAIQQLAFELRQTQ